MINNDDNYVVKHGKNVVKAMPFAPSPKSHFLWVGLKPSKKWGGLWHCFTHIMMYLSI